MNEKQIELIKKLEEKGYSYELASSYGDDGIPSPDKTIIVVDCNMEDESLLEELEQYFDVAPDDEFVVVDNVAYRCNYDIGFIPQVFFDREDCEWKLIKDNLEKYVEEKKNKLEICNLSEADIFRLDPQAHKEREICDGFCEISAKKEKLLEEIKELNDKGYDVLFTIDAVAPFKDLISMWKLKIKEV